MSMITGTIKFIDGVACIEVRGEVFKVHKEITIAQSQAGNLCTDLEIIRRHGYVREFNIGTVRYHKEMKPIRSKGDPEPEPDKMGPEDDRPPATAPYNFVPLQREEELVQSEGKAIDFSSFRAGHTGYFELDVTCLTPLFIRGEREKFFAIDGNPTLPGSSLRGMIRNLVKIVSHGNLIPGQGFEDARYYNRSAFDVESRIKWYYQQKMEGKLAGFLNYDPEEQSYFLLPSAQEAERTEPSKDKEFQYEANPEEGQWTVYSGLLGMEKKHWIIFSPAENAEAFYLSDQDIEDYRDDHTRNTRGEMRDILQRCRTLSPVDFPYGLPVFYAVYTDPQGMDRIAFGHTGFFRSPYHLRVSDHVPKKIRERQELPDLADAIFGFVSEGDEQSMQAGRVFFEDSPMESGGISPAEFPHILSSPKPTSFQLYLEQLPHGFKTQRESLSHWGDGDTLIRGHKLYWHQGGGNWVNSKPSVRPQNGKQAREWAEKYPQDFKMPGKDLFFLKSFHAYQGKCKEIVESIFFPGGRPAGNKKGKKEAKEETRPQFTPMAPVKKDAVFTGRVRFENLSPVELGALCFALDLLPGLAHKLGMGKPLGLGSVRLKPTLYLEEKAGRYSKLFGNLNEGGTLVKWHQKPVLESLGAHKDAFAAYVGEQTGRQETKTAADLWALPRMETLKVMLTTDIPLKDWHARTRYADFATQKGKDAFKERHVLPTPEEVVDPNTYPNNH